MSHGEEASGALPAARGGAGPVAIVGAVAGLYVGQSIISGLTFSALPTVLRERGLPLDHIGLLYLVILPWAIKFLWAPAVERYRLPAGGRTRSRQIVAAGGAVSAVALTAVAAIGPEGFWPLLGVLMVIAVAASTVDIACDGHAVEALSVRHHGWGNAAQVGGAYLGSAIGSGLFLLLVAGAGWGAAVLAMAALVVAGGVPFLLSRPPFSARTPSEVPSLRRALRRPAMRAGLMLAAVFTVAHKWGISLLGPFLVDAGFDLGTIGAVNGIGGTLLGCAFALIGGGLVRLWNARGVLVTALALQSLTLAGLAGTAWVGNAPPAVLIALGLTASSALMALGFVALYSEFMTLSDPRQAGVDFTLLQCVDALVSMAGGLGAGWISEHFGFAVFFAIAAAIACMAAPLAAWLCRGLVPGAAKHPAGLPVPAQ